MWYLSKDGDKLSDIYFDDSIELTDEQAQQAITAKMLGKVVGYENNELIFTESVKENVEPETYEPTAEELKVQNESQKAYLIRDATQQIAILQDAIDLAMSETGDEDKLKEWKKYRVLLSRIDTSLTDIEWPTKP